MQSESMDNYYSPRCHPRRHGGLLLGEQMPSPKRNLDPMLQALDYISASLFVHAILNQKASPHFALPKFQMYYRL